MSSKRITIVLTAAVLTFFGVYIYLTSSLSAMGYELEKREVNLDEAVEKRNELVVKLANYKTPQYLLQMSQEFDFVEVETPGLFIDTRGSALGQALGQ